MLEQIEEANPDEIGYCKLTGLLVAARGLSASNMRDFGNIVCLLGNRSVCFQPEITGVSHRSILPSRVKHGPGGTSGENAWSTVHTASSTMQAWSGFPLGAS
jgi:hypothetical protein